MLLGHTAWTDEQRRLLFSESRGARLRPMEWQQFLGGVFGYIISSSGAEKLLWLAERDGIQNGIDWFVMKKRDELKVLQAVPHIVFSPLAIPGGEVDSDIEHGSHWPLPDGRGSVISRSEPRA